MATIKISIKWGSKQFKNIEVYNNESPALFQAQLFELTGVPVERQKILGTRKPWRAPNIESWDRLGGIKNGMRLQLIGSAEAAPKISDDAKERVFLEDLPENVQQSLLSSAANGSSGGLIISPPGLKNLGNTCYANSVVQILHAVPPLRDYIESKFPSNSIFADLNKNLLSSMSDVFRGLDPVEDEKSKINSSIVSDVPSLNKLKPTVTPMNFITTLRSRFPEFNQTGEHGNPLQCDAQECMVNILQVMKENDQNPVIEEMFGGELESQWKCLEAPEESSSITKEQFTYLNCHIDQETIEVLGGLQKSMQNSEDKIEKFNSNLNRNAMYTKSSRISKLPKFIMVQFVRFFWNDRAKVRGKILRSVKFPLSLDCYNLCTESLQEELRKQRNAEREADDKKIENERKAGESSSAMEIDSTEIDKPEGENARRELIGVLTHKGRTADSGHYMAYIRQTEDVWARFDDDVVTQVKHADIQNLAGGGDWHMAYILLYGPKTW